METNYISVQQSVFFKINVTIEHIQSQKKHSLDFLKILKKHL
jgi:hypothetical protein